MTRAEHVEAGDIGAQRQAFDVPDEIAYFNTASLAPILPDDARGRVLPALADANCFAALRGSSLRIAPHLHITQADIDRLFDALASVI